RLTLYRIFITIGGLLVIALFTALLAPFFVDWTAHRAAFEAEASRIIGQPVKVSGDASMRILPLPTVTFSDISVGQYEDGAPMMTADSFSMDAELMPFLRGEVRIVDMRLDQPRALIRVNENGAIAWTQRKEALVEQVKVKLERLVVTGGSFEIEGLAGGRKISGEGFDADISAQGLTGPWRITAAGSVDGVPSEFSIATGRLQEEGSIRIAIEGRRLDQPYRLTVDGPVEMREGILAWNGVFGVAPVPGRDGKPDPAALPVAASGTFFATPNAVEVPEYRVEVGERADPYVVTGKATARIREDISFRVEADGRQIDLDRLQRAGPDDGAPPAGGLAARFAILRGIIDKIPVPRASGEIDFELPAIVAGDTVIREVSALVRPDGDGWQVERMRATLPGNTTFEASGRLSKGEAFGFQGHMLVASRQPTGFANWLSGTSDASLRRLRSAGFSADVTLGSTALAFDDLELVLDGVSIRGSLRREDNAGAAPLLVAVLEGEEIDFEDLKAIQALTGEGAGSGPAGHDIDLTLKAGLLKAEGMEARDVDMQLRIAKGSISVDRLNAGDFYGARLESSGRISDILGRASGNLGLTMKADNADMLVALARERLGENRFLDALASEPALTQGLDVNFSLDARPEGEGAKAVISAKGELGGTRFDIRDEFEGSPAQWGAGRHGLTAKLGHDSPDVLARQLSLPALPLPPEGPLTIDLELTGKPLEKMEGLVALTAPGANVSASGSLHFEPMVATGAPDLSRPVYEAALTAGLQDADPWLFMFGQALPGAGEGTPFSISANAKGDSGSNAFNDISGQAAGNGFSGSLTLATPPSSRAKLSGKLAFETLSLPVLAELATGAGTFGTQSIDNSLSETEFQVSPVSGLDGEIGLSSRIFETGFGAPAQDFTAQGVLAEGAVALSQASAQWLGGRFSGSLAIRNVAGSAAADINGRLSGFDLAVAVAAAGHDGVLTGTGDAAFSLDAEGRSLKALVSGLAGSGNIALRDLVANGIRAGELAEVLPDADVEGFVVDSANVVPLAERAFTGGELVLGDVAGTFTVSAGKAAIRNLSASLPQTRVTGEVSGDLASGETVATVAIAPDPGKEAIAGAEPAVTFTFEGNAGEMRRMADTSALEGYLSLRAFEREQRRVEILQASVLEKQRLRREIIGANAREARREEEALAEQRRLLELQRRLEEERAARQEAEAKRKAEEEAARKAAEEAAARKAAEEEAARKAAEEEAARKAAAEAVARREAEEEAARKAAAEEEARRKRESQQQLESPGTAVRRPSAEIPEAGVVVEDLPPPGSGEPQKPKPLSPNTLFENLDRLFQ
nr:hypothetical protein [Nitratireductor sp.]